MVQLAEPFNALELQDGESVSFTVLRWETGERVIYPGHAPAGKQVKVLRVHVPLADVGHFPAWWDITSTRLYALLLPQFQLVGNLVVRWTVTAHGFQAKKYFSVERVTA